MLSNLVDEDQVVRGHFVLFGSYFNHSEDTVIQGRTLVHFSAQLEPCLTHKNSLHTLHTPCQPLNTGTGNTTPKRTPYPIKGAQVELKSGRV